MKMQKNQLIDLQEHFERYYKVLSDLLLKNHNVNCFTFEKNTRQPYNYNLCLFRALDLHLHANEKLEEETSKIFNFFLNSSEERDPSKF